MNAANNSEMNATNQRYRNERAIVLLLSEFVGWYNNKFSVSKKKNNEPVLTVGIAGGFAAWAFCKWLLLEDPDWDTRDCDVYIHPSLGGVLEWRHVTDVFVEWVEIYADHVITEVTDERTVRYNASNEDMYVKDFYFDDFDQSISFIFDPSANNSGHTTVQGKMHTVIESYDINIVQVILYIYPYVLFETSDEVEVGLKTKKARVIRNFTFLSFCPSNLEIGALTRTLKRVQKYTDRGFKFTNFPKIECLAETNNPTCKPHDKDMNKSTIY